LAGALPQTPLAELTALPRPPSWILGVLLLRGGRGGKGEGRGRGRESERRGRPSRFAPPGKIS